MSMSRISWFECKECSTEWYEFDVRKGASRTCRGDDCDEKILPHVTRRKAFGHFKCSDCLKTWSSAYTYANTYQKCKSCNVSTLPYAMSPLEFSGKKSGDSPHMESLCGMCIKLGHRCCNDEIQDVDEILSSFATLNLC